MRQAIILTVFLALPLGVSGQTFREEAAPHYAEIDKLCVTYPDSCVQVDMNKTEVVRIEKPEPVVCSNPLAGKEARLDQALQALPGALTTIEAFRQLLSDIKDDSAAN